ncbi:ATP-dependent helicase, partial [Francisella tularensis subsp. holarctica]|nr:ATP-dependent helicase [Francisella tularensis subsp. holarctica]
KDLKQKLASQIASDISQAANCFAALKETVDKAFKQKNILAISHSLRNIFNNVRIKKAEKAIDFILQCFDLEKQISKVSGETH